MIDSFFRAVELFPLKAGDAESVASCLFDVYHRYGRPVRVRCDRAKAFLKSVINRFQKMMGVATHASLLASTEWSMRAGKSGSYAPPAGYGYFEAGFSEEVRTAYSGGKTDLEQHRA